jgi:WD40 repeat protein
VRSLALGPSPETFAAGSLGGSIVVGNWPLSSPMSAQSDVGNQAANGATRGAVTALAFQRKGKWLASGRADGGVELWDWRNGRAGDHRELKTPGFAVTSLAISDGNVLAAGGKSGVLLWKGLPASDPIQLHRGSEVWALDLSRDGRFLVAGTAAGEILQWDLQSGSLSPTKLAEKGLPVRALRFSANGEWLAAARGNGAILLWKTGRPQDPPVSLPGHKSWVWSLDFSPDNEWLVSGSEDRTVRFWPVHPERLVQDVCRHLGRRDLNEAERERYLNGGGPSPTCPQPASRAEAHATP